MTCKSYIILGPLRDADPRYYVFLDLQAKLDLDMDKSDVAEALGLEMSDDDFLNNFDEIVYHYCLSRKDRFVRVDELEGDCSRCDEFDDWTDVYTKVYKRCRLYELTPAKLAGLIRKRNEADAAADEYFRRSRE